MFRRVGALLLCAALAGALSPARAQQEKGKGPGFLREIRRALSLRPASEIWDEASRQPSAERAFPLMENLLERTGDPLYASRAALWLGHFEYGAGQVDDALRYFEQALSKGASEEARAEALFWREQCRNLLGQNEPGEGAPSSEGGTHAALSVLARHDGELRAGQIDEALRGYLALEGDARRTGCLGPLLYRIGLAVASGSARGSHPEVDWGLVQRWERFVPASPERALVAAMAVPAAQPEAAPADSSAASGAESPAPSFPESAPESPTPAEQGREPDGAEEPQDQEPARSAPSSDRGEAERPDSAHPYYVIQLGAFIDSDRARRENERLVSLGLPVHLEQEEMRGLTYYKIRMSGRSSTRAEAEAEASRTCHGLDWQVVRITP